MFLVVMTRLVFGLDEFFDDRISIVLCRCFEKQIHIMFQERYRTVFWQATDLYSLMFVGV